MAENLLAFRAGIPITADGQMPSPDFFRFLMESVIRQGGAVAPSITELDSQQYADAGIEENKAALYALADLADSSPSADLSHLAGQFEALQKAPVCELTTIDILTSEVNALREQVAKITTDIDNLKAGKL